MEEYFRKISTHVNDQKIIAIKDRISHQRLFHFLYFYLFIYFLIRENLTSKDTEDC